MDEEKDEEEEPEEEGSSDKNLITPTRKVGKKLMVSLCKLKSLLIYTRIAKPFTLPLRIFFVIRVSFRNCETETKMRASEQAWRILSSPIEEEKRLISFRALKSLLIYTRIAKTRCSFFVFRLSFRNRKTATRMRASEQA